MLTGSAGLLAEAGHSVADTGNQGLLMFGSSAAAAPPTAPTRSATGRSATSGRSSSRSCCSAWAACSRSYEGIQKVGNPHEIESAGDRVRHPRLLDRPRDVLAAHRGEGGQPRPRRPIVVELHPHRQGTGAARRAARGRRRRGRSAVRARRPLVGRDHRQRPLGRRRLDRHRRAARRHRDHPRGRDEGPADRRGGERREPRRASMRRSPPPTR